MKYEDWLNLYASKCNRCNGRRFVEINGIKVQCICQSYARKKWRLQQIEITPPEIKFLSWTDFTGTITKGGEIEGHLTFASAKAGRDAAFKYCFGRACHSDILKDRRKYIIVHKHLEDGQNVIIAGEEECGKTLLGVLILKEIAYASQIIGKDLEYRWVRFYNIINAARWSVDSTCIHNIDHPYLDNLSQMDFLFIDDIDMPRGGHNSPPDHVAMNRMFGTRKMLNLPTIFICPIRFLKMIRHKQSTERIADHFGNEVVRMLTNKNNLIIELVKA